MDVFLTAFAQLLATIDPFGLLPIFLAVTTHLTDKERNKAAWMAPIVGSLILVFFLLVGKPVIAYLGIGVPAFQISGGILLFLIALEIIFDRRHKRKMEKAEAVDHINHDVIVFPLAAPFFAGPAAITATLVLQAKAHDVTETAIIIGALSAVTVITICVLYAASRLNKFVPTNLTNVINRLLGIVICALAVQIIIDGVMAVIQTV